MGSPVLLLAVGLRSSVFPPFNGAPTTVLACVLRTGVQAGVDGEHDCVGPWPSVPQGAECFHLCSSEATKENGLWFSDSERPGMG